MALPENNLKQQVRDMPDAPGIYKYYDTEDKLLYIGKAKSLKKRVSSYFVSKGDNSHRISLMISKINRIEYTVVPTEYDALLLENNLIKKYQPRYNVSLRDDKTYPYLAIKNEPFPRVFPTRNRIKDGSEYFGPYANVGSMKVMLELIRKLLPTRSCSYNLTKHNIESGKFRVCLDYHIKLCKGPCEGLQSAADYNDNIEQIRHILKGYTKEVGQYLKGRLNTMIAELNFEEAANLKDKLDLLAKFQARSTVVNAGISKVDVFSIVSNEKSAFVNYLRVVNGNIITTDTIEIRKKLDESDEEILLLAIADLRQKYDSNSRELIIPFPVELEDGMLKFTVPKLGDKRKLLELSQKNAFHYFQDKIKSAELNKERRKHTELLTQAKTDLGLKSIPYHIECFDNSNLQGSSPVSAIVVFRDGKPSRREYRHFNVKTVTNINDFATMEEAVYRRYRRMLAEEQPLPQLIIIDGGKGQLSAAVKSLKVLKIEDKVDIIGIAKRLEEIYKPGDPFPLSINKKSQTLKLIQRARDEAHAHGVGKHRKKRIATSLVTELENIPGIGKKTAEKLLTHFKSVKKLKEAGGAELEGLVGKAKAKMLLDIFNEQVPPPSAS